MYICISSMRVLWKGVMTKEEMVGEYHEHPLFNGQYHNAVWIKTWVSDGTNNEAPEDAPILCAICGRSYGN